MSESNSVRVSVVQRTSFDTPAALNMLVLPTTGQSLRNRVGYQQSQTLRTDANVQDLVRLSRDTGGSLPFEFTFPVVSEALWLLLRAAMRATEDAQRQEASATTTAGAKTITKAAIDFTAGNTVEPGDIVKVSGSSGGVDDGYYKVTSAAATTLTVERSANFTGSVGNVTVTRGARMKNGTQRYWFDAEIGRVDASLFELFEQLVVGGFDLNISDGQITTANFQLQGVSTQRAGSSLCLGHTNPTSGPILDALGVPVFNVGGGAYSAKSISLSVQNNIRMRTQITSSIASAITGASWGAFEVRSRIQSYLANFTEITNYVGNVETDLWFVMQNASGQAVSFAMPAVKWTDLGADTRGLNQDDYLEGEAQAKVHSTQGISLRMQRWVS